MSETLSILLLCFLLWMIWKVARMGKTDASETKISEPQVSISIHRTATRSFEAQDLGTLTQTADGAWVLNPKSPFPLTITNVAETFVRDFKAFCDEKRFLGVEQFRWALVPKIARSNLRCKEIDEYIRAFKPQYLKEVERLKSQSGEWATAGEKDRVDLLETIRLQAVQHLDVQPGCDLVTLFQCEPTDATIDDALIDRFGFDTLQFYFRYAGDLKKVHIIPAEYGGQREAFEKLVGEGLASRGVEISLVDILSILKLKDMSDMVADLNPPRWGRKSQAIEFLMTVPDLRERLSKMVSFRELFQVKSLPPEFSRVDLDAIASSWRYAAEIAWLISRTYIGGAMYLKGLREDHEAKNWSPRITGWEWNQAPSACPYCKRVASENLPKNHRKPTPLHIGCGCWVEAVYEGEEDV